MKLIALDSSGLTASCAILEDDILRAEYTVDFKKTHSQTLLPMLDALASMTELDLSTVDAIAVAAGPGSFTGLRIGSATVKGLGLALGKPVIEVPTLAGLAWNLWGAKGLIAPVMDARRSQVYSGLYRFENGSFVTVRDQAAVSVEDLADELNAMNPADGIIFLGDGVQAYRETLDRLVTVPHLYAPPHKARQRASSVGALARLYYEEGRVTDADAHAPVYLRKSQAEREREQQLLTGEQASDPFSRAASARRI